MNLEHFQLNYSLVEESLSLRRGVIKTEAGPGNGKHRSDRNLHKCMMCLPTLCFHLVARNETKTFISLASEMCVETAKSITDCWIIFSTQMMLSPSCSWSFHQVNQTSCLLCWKFRKIFISGQVTAHCLIFYEFHSDVESIDDNVYVFDLLKLEIKLVCS